MERPSWAKETKRSELSAGKWIAAVTGVVLTILAYKAVKSDAPFQGLETSSNPETSQKWDQINEMYKDAKKVKVVVFKPNGGKVNFRSDPIVADRSADNKIGEISNGTELEVIPVKGKNPYQEVWGLTVINGRTVYIYETYLKRVEDQEIGLRAPDITIYDPETGNQALWDLPR